MINPEEFSSILADIGAAKMALRDATNKLIKLFAMATGTNEETIQAVINQLNESRGIL